MTDTATLTASLVALHSALVDKLGEQPYFAPDLTLNQSGKWRIHLYRERSLPRIETLHVANGDTAEACLEAAHAYVAAMPDHGIKARRDWHGKLATVIDEGHALSLPDDVMQPLRTGSQAMAKNLLAAPGAV